MSVITRFAPSPTGDLHIGGVRTALYSYLYAQKHKGEFVLRIEDTDRQRSTPEAVQVILDGMQWLGLTPTVGPIYQSERFEAYQTVITRLIEEGKAYRCYCSKARLEALREEQVRHKQKPKYDGHCRHLDPEAGLPKEGAGEYVIRFKQPQTAAVVIEDVVRGQVTIQNSELDDLIIQRSDGSPTYNLTVVVDDWQMNITHVIRGDDHLNNTPRQINLFLALGLTPPKYAHIPMILGEDGKKLSKRTGAASVLTYQQQGILPEALLNYLVRLGWSYQDQEIFSIDEMIRLFDLTDINASAAAMNQEKLLWLNQHYLKTLPESEIAKRALAYFHAAGIAIDEFNQDDLERLERLVCVQRERVNTLVDLVEKSRYFYEDITEYNEEAVAKFILSETKPALTALYTQLEALPAASWHPEALGGLVREVAKSENLKMPHLAQPLRIALTGDVISPSIDQTLALMGPQRTLTRLEAMIKTKL